MTCANWRVAVVCLSVLAPVALAADGPIPALPAPPAEQVQAAVAEHQTFGYTHKRSSHTTGMRGGGSTFFLAVASWAGDTTGDATLLGQIRHNLTGDACMVAAGGYGAQHERIFTGACVLIRHTPRLWDQLTGNEKHQIDLLMKAALVASAYTTSDVGNADGGQNTDMMGGRNLNRRWNPNYREGMIGMMIVGTIWLGGGDQAYAFLDNYDHAAFTEQLRKAGLTNTYLTFNWRADHPDSGAPDAERIQRHIRDYSYRARRLDRVMEIYWLLIKRTYDATVSPGLNDGAGVDGAGRIASGAEGLPNVGRTGMLHEFAGVDAGGPRSSIGYAYSGFRPNLINQVVMLISGYWERGAMAFESTTRMKVGIIDLYYKLEHGYLSYSKGRASRRPPKTDGTLSREQQSMRSLWTDVVEPFHDGRVTCANAGEDIPITRPTAIRLDGSASTAAAGEKLVSYRWLAADGAELATGERLTVDLPPGTHAITLEVTDSNGRVSRDGVTVVVSE